MHARAPIGLAASSVAAVAKVKQFLQHLRLCNFRGHASSTQLTRAELRACTPECWRCAKIASLLQLHAAQCDNERCLVCSDFRQFIYPSILRMKCPRVLMPPPPPRCPLAELQANARSPRDGGLSRSVEDIVLPAKAQAKANAVAESFVPVAAAPLSAGGPAHTKTSSDS